jgi:hypothetical protein
LPSTTGAAPKPLVRRYQAFSGCTWPSLHGIDFLVYSRSAGVEPDQSLTEEHWSYMDRFADRMTARGPTLAADRDTWTGSLHIVDLPGADAAREFVEREPYNRAGLFKSHVIRRFENLLGRTMWEFPGDSVDSRFLVFAHLHSEPDEHHSALTRAGFTASQRERLIIHGELSTPDEAAPAGVVLALRAPTAEAVDAVLKDGPICLEETVAVEIHDWEFGGRR